MRTATNTFWNDSRLSTQRPAARAVVSARPAPPVIGEGGGWRTVAGRRDLALPSWVVFCMIILATFAVCATVTMRTHAEKLTAERKFDEMSADVQRIRTDNVSLQREIERMRTDPRTVEAVARTRMNMVRANEVVIPLE